MSSRVLRKLQGDSKELPPDDVSDNEGDLSLTSSGGVGGGGARRKQLNINRYDLLNQQSHSESEVKEDDNETEAAKSCEGEAHDSVKRKKKKRKKKPGRYNNTQKSSEDNADVDEVERSVREVNRLLGDNFHHKIPPTNTTKTDKNIHIRKNILSVQHKHLNPNNELKRIFGSKIVQSEHKRKKRGGRGHVKVTWLVTSKNNWPLVGKTGLSMSLVETKPGNIQYFAYEHSSSYRTVQNKFLEAVESLNPDNIVVIVNEHPYHIDALIQLSDLCKLSEDLAMAAEFIERALFCLEYAFHPLFNIAQGNSRLDYRRQENRALFITLFKHLTFVGGRACYRTALEFCKLLLSLDPENDPLAIKLALDFYALRAKEYNWLIAFIEEFENTKNLTQLPNFAFSNAIAHYYTSEHRQEDSENVADALLQDALLMFPGVLMPLLDKCSVRVDDRLEKHEFFKDNKKDSPALTQLILLYVNRSYHVWKENDLLNWLERNVHKVLNRVDDGDPIVQDYEAKRSKRYQGQMPFSIARHIILADIKGVSPTTNVITPVLSFDPLPPPDSINLYNRPRRPRAVDNNSSAVGIFFRSLLPNFNANNVPMNFLEGDEDGARALPDLNPNAPDGVDFRRSVASLVGAMRDLLNNIRMPDVPNDADVDDDDDSDEDDEQNHYLT